MNRNMNGACPSPYLTPAKLTTPRRFGSANHATDRTTVIHRSFSCQSRREEEYSANEVQSKDKNNRHWSKIRKMTKEQYFTKQTMKNRKNAVNDLKSKGLSTETNESKNCPIPARCSPDVTKDSKHWSKVRRMTKAGFFTSAKIIEHPPPTITSSRSGISSAAEYEGYDVSDSSNVSGTPPTSSRQQKCNDKLNRAKSAPQKDRKSRVQVTKSLKSILRQGRASANIRYIDIDSGDQVTFNDIIQYRRRSSVSSNSSRTTFNDADGRPMTSYTVGEESKYIHSVNIIETFDVPKKELQVLNMKKMTPFKYVYVLSKCLPQIVSKNYRPSADPEENDLIYQQRLRENCPQPSRPHTPCSAAGGPPVVSETLTELNLVSA